MARGSPGRLSSVGRRVCSRLAMTAVMMCNCKVKLLVGGGRVTHVLNGVILCCL